MRRALETLFRHSLQLLILVVLLPVIGVVATYVLVPKTYPASAALFALHRYEVIGATGLESDLNSTPAQTQVTALTDLLQTRSFALEVVKGIDLAPTLDLSSSVLADPQELQDALANEIAKNVQVTAPGYQLFQITYSNRNPQVALQIVDSIIQHYGPESLALSVADGKDLLTTYQSQLQSAQQAENAAIAAENQYAAAHPSAAKASDPEYQQLQAAVQQAEANVQTIQSNISQTQQSISAVNGGPGTLYQVVDAPQVAQFPASRVKDFLIGGGIGLAVALLAGTLYLVILVRRNRVIYSAYDVQEAVAVPIVMQLPTLASSSVKWVVGGTVTE